MNRYILLPRVIKLIFMFLVDLAYWTSFSPIKRKTVLEKSDKELGKSF